jgi:hypothetical protein
MGEDLISSSNGKSARRAPRTRVPENESREDKFVRLAEQRMPNVQKHMRLVCNLADYPHTDEQRGDILGELRSLLGEVEAAFAPANRRDAFKFKR